MSITIWFLSFVLSGCIVLYIVTEIQLWRNNKATEMKSFIIGMAFEYIRKDLYSISSKDFDKRMVDHDKLSNYIYDRLDKAHEYKRYSKFVDAIFAKIIPENYYDKKFLDTIGYVNGTYEKLEKEN